MSLPSFCVDIFSPPIPDILHNDVSIMVSDHCNFPSHHFFFQLPISRFCLGGCIAFSSSPLPTRRSHLLRSVTPKLNAPFLFNSLVCTSSISSTPCPCLVLPLIFTHTLLCWFQHCSFNGVFTFSSTVVENALVFSVSLHVLILSFVVGFFLLFAPLHSSGIGLRSIRYRVTTSSHHHIVSATESKHSS